MESNAYKVFFIKLTSSNSGCAKCAKTSNADFNLTASISLSFSTYACSSHLNLLASTTLLNASCRFFWYVVRSSVSMVNIVLAVDFGKEFFYMIRTIVCLRGLPFCCTG